jgi:hypothetical protein
VQYNRPSDAERVRELLARAGLGQRAADRELDIPERTMRYCCAGQEPVPRVVMPALEHLASCLKVEG